MENVLRNEFPARGGGMHFRAILYLFACFTILGCSTKSRHFQSLDLRTEPSGLMVEIDGKRCKTPCTLEGISRYSTNALIYTDDNIVPIYLENELEVDDIVRTIKPLNISAKDINVKVDQNLINQINSKAIINLKQADENAKLHEYEDKQRLQLFITLLGIASTQPTNNNSFGNSIIQTPNAYGPGVHMNQYGQPVQVVPTYNGTGYYGNSYIKTPNAYGPGIHMDQYGQPVSVIPR